MTRAIFISAVNEEGIYKRCILDNKFVKNRANVQIASLDNSKDNRFIPVRYNQFVDSYDFSGEAWFVFCHSDWEIMEDIVPRLEMLDKDCLYGPIGAIISKNDHGVVVSERRGRIYDRKRDGSNLRLMECYAIESGTEVDTFDCQCLIVHSSLIKKHSLRFDENLEFDLYVEDFCLNARVSYGIRSRILRLDCCHWQQLEDINERPHYFDKVDYINNKYGGYLFGTTILPIGGNSGHKIEKMTHAPVALSVMQDRSAIYHWDVDLANVFDARVIALNYIERGKTVLDVGCACGDFGKALKKEKACRIYGMEYDKGSIELAKKTESFEDIYQIDLNSFEVDSRSDLKNKFDYIVFGDVLEHVMDPQKVLQNFKKLLKKDGFFIISLPNIAHASIKAGLLHDEFEYGDIGLLDRTHLKFFTYKSIASLLSGIYLQVTDVKFVPLDMHGFSAKDYYANLPDPVRQVIFSSPHSFVCQYVMKISSSDSSKVKINEANMERLGMAGGKAPEQIKNIMRNRKIRSTEIDFIKSSKFWKMREAYIKYRSKMLFLVLSPRKFVKKYFRI